MTVRWCKSSIEHWSNARIPNEKKYKHVKYGFQFVVRTYDNLFLTWFLLIFIFNVHSYIIIARSPIPAIVNGCWLKNLGRCSWSKQSLLSSPFKFFICTVVPWLSSFLFVRIQVLSIQILIATFVFVFKAFFLILILVRFQGLHESFYFIENWIHFQPFIEAIRYLIIYIWVLFFHNIHFLLNLYSLLLIEFFFT